MIFTYYIEILTHSSLFINIKSNKSNGLIGEIMQKCAKKMKKNVFIFTTKKATT